MTFSLSDIRRDPVSAVLAAFDLAEHGCMASLLHHPQGRVRRQAAERLSAMKREMLTDDGLRRFEAASSWLTTRVLRTTVNRAHTSSCWAILATRWCQHHRPGVIVTGDTLNIAAVMRGVVLKPTLMAHVGEGVPILAYLGIGRPLDPEDAPTSAREFVAMVGGNRRPFWSEMRAANG